MRTTGFGNLLLMLILGAAAATDAISATLFRFLLAAISLCRSIQKRKRKCRINGKGVNPVIGFNNE